VDVFDVSSGEVVGMPELFARGARVTLHRIDTVDRIEQRIGDGLPADEVAAQKALARWLRESGEVERRALVRGWAALLVLDRYEIARVPAVVFNDGEAVVYGVRDLGEAVARWRRWRNP
jgi:integrating conjugative element protein (TIGR03757 family)